MRNRKKDSSPVSSPVSRGGAPEAEAVEGEAKKSPEVNIMVIEHSESPSGYISGDGSPPVSPVVYDEAPHRACQSVGEGWIWG